MVASGKWGREKPETGRLVRGQSPSKKKHNVLNYDREGEEEVDSKIISEQGKTRLSEKLRHGPTTA